MRKVKNNQAIKHLAMKSFAASRTRNIMAVIAIALTAVLFTAVFTVGVGMAQDAEQNLMLQAGSDMHGVIKDVTQGQIEVLKGHPLIKEYGRDLLAADVVANPEFLKRHVELHYVEPNLYPHWFFHITDGRAPKAADEIMLDKKSMELLGLEPKAGCKVTLVLEIRRGDEPVSRTFSVSGVIDSSKGMNVGFAIVSEAYLEKYAVEIAKIAEDKGCVAGKTNMDIMFADAKDIQGKLNQVITDSGFSVDPSSPGFIDSNANWAFLSENTSDPMALGGIVAALVLILLTGYLIIYNIFHISVIRDIRYYGLLKTIGTTARQTKRILRRQAYMLCVLGMPAGLVIGYFIGKVLLPLVLSAGDSTGNHEVMIAPHPWIFIGSALFTVITVLLSEWKPARIASKVSPVEALHYTEQGRYAKKAKKSTDGGKPARMAFSNLGRNKGRTAIVIISLSLTVVLMNSIYTVTSSIERESFLSKMILCEDLIGNAALWNYDYFPLNETEAMEVSLSESFIAACEGQEGFMDGGRIYMAPNGPKIPAETWEVPEYIPVDGKGAPGEYYPNGFMPFNRDEEGAYCTEMHGIERFILDKMTVVEGESDPDTIWEKLCTGQFILYSVDVDDNSRIIENKVKYHAGDMVTLKYADGMVKEYEILSVVKGHSFSLTNRTSNTFPFYVSAEEFKGHFSDAYLMSFLFDVKEGYQKAMHAFLEQYTAETEPAMSFESRETYADSFDGIVGMIAVVGTGLAGIIGVIGILNFINVMMTSVAVRKREFAMMEAIGMTKRQLVFMLSAEGVYYALLTAAFSATAASLFSLTALRMAGEGIWFINYRFTLFPALCACPVLILFGWVLPRAVWVFRKKEGLVEVMRE